MTVTSISQPLSGCRLDRERRPAVFLDRDGTIVREVNYLSRIEDLELLAGAGEAIARLNRLGLPVILVSNQSGVARGLFDTAFVERCHHRLQELLAPCGAHIDAFFFCPHHPTAGRPPYRKTCDCRKPAPGMLWRAARQFDLELKNSFVIGDKECDLELAAAVGARGILVATGYGRQTAAEMTKRGTPPDPFCRDLNAAVDWIEERLSRPEG